MRWLLRAAAFVLVLGSVHPAQGDGADPVVAVVGREVGDLGPLLASLRLQPAVVAELSAIPEGAAAVLVLADGGAGPRALTEADGRRLEDLVAAGARVFLEYARLPEGSLGCTSAAEPRRPLYERLVVLTPLGALQPEDLLEEHDQACLPLVRLPPGAEVLLEYDRALGTYRRIPTPDPGLFSVTVDLGSEQVLAGASQRYGAGQPNYRPESVEVSFSRDGSTFRPAGRTDTVPMPETVRFELPREPARFVRFAARKFRRSPVTDFFFMGEVEVSDAAGHNLALNAPYTVASTRGQSPGYGDSGGELTDGRVEGLYTDGLSVGWGTAPVPADNRFPGLIRVPRGNGLAFISAARLSDFRRRGFRLTERWEELWREILLDLLPPGRRAEIAVRRVPLSVHTEPRGWAEPGTPVALVIETDPTAVLTAASRLQGDVGLSREGSRRTGRFRAMPGTDEITVRAQTATGSAEQTVTFDSRPRAEAYRQALDRSLAWFQGSGVLPRADGSGGVYSQVCLAWLDSQPVGYDVLGSPFRVDCNAMTAEAFALYGRLSGQEPYLTIARNLADTVVAHQYTDATRASLGGFPWLYANNDTLFLWDDNCRIGTALLWLYHWTGEERYLRSALLGAELFRQVARDDGCVHRHAIERAELDSLGREAYRQFGQGADPEFRLMHWWTLAAVTGDRSYRDLATTCGRLWGGTVGPFGGSFTARYAPDPDLTQRLSEHAEAFLHSPTVQRFGMVTVGGGGYEAAFEGDCGIATGDGEPLTDQIYDTPWRFLWALRAWKATGDASCRRVCETVGDYLVRTQCSSPDRRLDGCWMRGFDVEHWETYGAPYDPAYGPYSAYTGWMNAVAAQAFAWYLLDEPPFIPEAQHPQAEALLARVRSLNPGQVSDGPNVAMGSAYRLSDPPSGAYTDDGKKLTDGVVDGPYADRLSVGWGIPVQGQTKHVLMDLDLGQLWHLALVTQQYGAGRGSYNPDVVRVAASTDGLQYQDLGEQRFGGTGAGLLWIRLDPPASARHLRFEIAKRRISGETDFLFVGETRAYEAR